MATALEEVATAADDGGIDLTGGLGNEQISPAPQRFASAVQASLTAAQAGGDPNANQPYALDQTLFKKIRWDLYTC